MHKINSLFSLTNPIEVANIWAAETAAFSNLAVMLSAVGADDILVVALAPTGFDDCVEAPCFVGEIKGKGDEAVELGEINHSGG